MKLEDLTPEQQNKAKACKSKEDLIELAKSEGVELADEQLEALSGGEWDCMDVCSNFSHHPDCSAYEAGSSRRTGRS